MVLQNNKSLIPYTLLKDVSLIQKINAKTVIGVLKNRV